MKKMNNKGFSLVELIVVVLIMAIIAVALAPQVMKWVENSRKSNDIENYNALITAANVAGTNETVINALSSGGSVSMASTGTTITPDALKNAMKVTLPDAENIKVESSWTGSSGVNQPPFNFTVSVDANGLKITKGNYPIKDFS